MSLDFALDLYLRGSVVLVLALVASWSFRRASASQRSLMQSLGFATLLVLPVALFLAPAWEFEVLPAPEPASLGPEVSVEQDAWTFDAVPVPLGELELMVTGPTQPRITDRERVLRALPWIWAGVSLLLVVRILLRRVLTARALRRRDGEQVVESGLLRGLGLQGLRVVVTGRVQQPCVFGVLRPVVLLPTSFHEWSIDRKRAVLRHEAAHVLRRDALTELLVELGRALWWPQPLAWCLARGHRLLREHACDDAVLRAGGSATDYASELVQIARSLRSTQDPTPTGALAMVRTSDLETRVRALLRTDLQRLGPALWQQLGAGVFALAVTVFAGTAVAVAPQEPGVPPPPPVEETEEVEIPKAETIEDEGLVLFLDAKGVVRWSSTTIARDDLAKVVLGQLPEAGGRHRVTLRVDEKASSTELIDVAERLRALGDKIDLRLKVGKPEAQPILIAITAEGEVVFGGRKIGVNGLKPLLQRMLKKNPDRAVVIQTNAHASASLVIQAVDTAKDAGAKSVRFATLAPKLGPDPIILSVTKDGSILHDARPIGLAGVEPLMQRLNGKGRTRPVVIRANDDASQGLVVRLIEVVKKVGGKNQVVSLAADTEEKIATLDRKPRAIYKAQPRVNSDMRRRLATGAIKVDVLFVVDEEGRVEDAKVRSEEGESLAEGRDDFERAALQSIGKWRFQPGIRDGRPVPARMRQSIVFPKR